MYLSVLVCDFEKSIIDNFLSDDQMQGQAIEMVITKSFIGSYLFSLAFVRGWPD